MGSYNLINKKEIYKKLLRVYDNIGFSKVDNELKNDDLKFIDEFKIIELFIILLDSFDVTKDLSNSVRFLELEIEKWNSANPDNKMEAEYLLSKYYLVSEGGRVISNPEIWYNNMSLYTVDKECIEFIRMFSDYTHYYPLFDESRLKELIEKHNNIYETYLSEELFLGEHRDFHNAIFHNYRGIRDAFLEAVKIKLGRVSYGEWNSNILYYFNLLLEISSSEIDISHVIKSMDRNKKKSLVKFSFDKLLAKCSYKIDDLNFLHRLKYVPHELEGENIYKPDKSSRLVVYDPNYYDVNNIFDRIEAIGSNFCNFTFEGSYSRLIKEIPFIFINFRDEFTIEQWEEIVEKNYSNIFIYCFLYYTLNKAHNVFDYKSIYTAPMIFDKLSRISIQHYEEGKNAVFSDFFKAEVLNFYLDYINETGVLHFNFLMDLYFYLSHQYDLRNSNNNTADKCKDKVIEQLVEYANQESYSNLVLEKIEKYAGEDFRAFDLYVNLEDQQKLKYNLTFGIIKKYMHLLSSEKFYKCWYRFKGMKNLLQAIAALGGEEKSKSGLFIDFPEQFSLINDKDVVDWHKYYFLSKKLRFHIGVLCLAIKEYGWDEGTAEYILNTYKSVRLISFNISNPLSWEETIHDNFVVSGRNAVKNDEILMYHVAELLKNKDPDYIKVYVESIRESLSYFEIILLNKALNNVVYIENKFYNNIENIAVGTALTNAYFLLNNGRPEEALIYIEYIEKISVNSRRGGYDDDYVNIIKYYCYIAIAQYGKAFEAAGKIKDSSISVPKIATAQYFMGNYSIAETQFEDYFQYYESDIEAIVNYSAVLISMNKNKDAIDWCEKHIEKYKDDYLLNANLACAYNSINKARSLYYFNEAQRCNPKYMPAIQGTLENLNDMIRELPAVLDLIDDFENRKSLMKIFTENSQEIIRAINNANISDEEMNILKEINKAIRLTSEKPVNIEKFSENELSDVLRDYLMMSLNHYGYEVSREIPQGYAASKSGEIDLFIYNAGSEYKNIATGEVKIWGKDKFKKQMVQLLGYMHTEGGFGFTVIFNKDTRLENVLSERDAILETFSFQSEDGNEIFEKTGSIIGMECYNKNLDGVILTLHKNPELDDSYVRVYHFILNACRPERKNMAAEIRRK